MADEEMTAEELEATSPPTDDDDVAAQTNTEMAADDDDDDGVNSDMVSDEPVADPVEKPVKQAQVPHAALHEERTKRQALEQKYDTMVEQNNQLNQRLTQLMERLAPPAPTPAAPAIPDKEQDPFAYMEYLENKINSISQTQEKTQQQTAAERQQQEIWEKGNAQAAEFRSKTPDYDEAFKYLYERRGQELLDLGFQREQVGQLLQQEAMQGMTFALQRGINPGQMLYNMARHRGYTPKQAAQAAADATGQNADSRLQRNMEANRSMGGSGRDARTTPALEDIVNMSDEEFSEWMDKNGDAGLAKMHGLG